VHVEAELHFIAQRQEAWRGNRHRHRVADDQVGLSMSGLVRAPGHRHDAHRAVEAGNIKSDVRSSVAAEFNDAGIERHYGFDCRVALHGHHAAIAAGSELAAIGAHAVDQPAVEIADFKRELRLRVEPRFRRRCFILRQVEDAEIDSRDGDEGVLALRQAFHFHRHGEFGA